MATLTSVYNELKMNLLSVRKDVAVNPGSVVSDVFLTPTANTLYRNRVLLDYTIALQSLYTIQLLLVNEPALTIIASAELVTVDDVRTEIKGFIDKIGSNFMLTRFAPTYATGTVFFGRIDPPGDDIIIPALSKIKTADGKQYTTDTISTMLVSDPNLYDSSTNLYVIEVPVTAVISGIAGNCVSYSITQFVNQISGFSQVFNKTAFTSGMDEETDNAFIERIRIKLSGNNFGTINGYKSLVLNNFRTVSDALVVSSGDPIMLRDDGMGGCVDIWVLEENPAITITEPSVSFNCNVGGLDGYTFLNQPIDQIIVSPVGSRLDDTTSLAHSYADTTSILFPPVGSGGPVPPFNLTYSYFKIIGDIQAFLQQPENAILGNTFKKSSALEDIALVKKAIVRYVDISAVVVLRINADASTLTQCQDAIFTFMSSLLLGQAIAQSDIVGILEAIAGVNYVILPLSKFNFEGATIAQVNDLVVNGNEYMRAGTISVS